MYSSSVESSGVPIMMHSIARSFDLGFFSRGSCANALQPNGLYVSIVLCRNPHCLLLILLCFVVGMLFNIKNASSIAYGHDDFGNPEFCNRHLVMSPIV